MALLLEEFHQFSKTDIVYLQLKIRMENAGDKQYVYSKSPTPISRAGFTTYMCF